MSTPSRHGTPLAQVLQHVSASARERQGLGAFARAFLHRGLDERLEARGVESAARLIEDLFHFADHRGLEPMAVRAINPTVETNGYTTEGTVVEVVIDDGPFLVDSITAEIQSHDYQVELVRHPVIGTRRDPEGRLVDVLHAREADTTESVQHYELDRAMGPDEARDLEAALRRVLGDVRRAVADFQPMQDAIARMQKIVRSGTARYSQKEADEAVAFLDWLLDLNFVFLGYREYRIVDSPKGPALTVIPESGLGILSDPGDSAYREPVPLSSLSPELLARYESGELLVVTKTNRRSTVHRRAKMDYVGVRHIGDDGEVIGEARLVGLFTSRAYMSETASIPVLRQKLARILEAEDLIAGSHDYKAVIQLFESFPMDELFVTPTEEIRHSIMGLLELEEKEQVRLFVRRDLLQRSVSLLVSIPRDRFNADLRKALQDHFVNRFEGSSVDYRLAIGDTGSARIHFTVWVADGQVPDVPFEELEEEVVALTHTWEDRVSEVLAARLGDEKGKALAERWAPRFPDYYKASTAVEMVAGDIACLDELSRGERPLLIGLQNESGPGERLTRLAVYRLDGKLELSAILPAIEALGLRVVEEVPTRLRGENSQTFIHDFGVLLDDGSPLDLERCGDRIARALGDVLANQAETDSLDRLIVDSRLDHHQVRILRAYRTYWRRVTPAFTLEYVNDAFAAHPHIAEALIELFERRFDPVDDVVDEEPLVAALSHDLDAVATLDEDRILRAFLGLIQATERTNARIEDRSALAFKVRSSEVPDMPRPYPLFEIFVYGDTVEGVHLRGGEVARGGIRWSTRREDYRTEVLGLMKAQMTKNAVIVPTGAKGGFVLRRTPADADVGEEVRRAYTTFIRSLLDVTDDLVEGTPRHPAGVRVHDGADPYLVVAADKGTATFSDTANAIAREYGFWLDDAFASGGSAGYDHKALGITARGAWESVKWHLRTLGVDAMTEPFTVAGIGDMSGDVFGNGMLLSPALRLVAAFDHRHVFIDPGPDPRISLEERRRLFAMPRSSWDDYDRTKLSAGGGIYPRSLKRIDLSPQACELLGLPHAPLTPNEVISAILRAPVDLLWNGGIGTYVKASVETHEQAGDRVNDAVRVDAGELRCRVVGEGGNLGLTQRARIEYATNGGRINTDFIDNSAGVNCSDREVNLKILLGLAEQRHELTRQERNDLIELATDDVVDRILYDNFLQAQILAQESAAASERMEDYEDLMQVLEADGMLDRTIEWLPSTEEMAERRREQRPLTSPELAVLVAYAKRSLSEWLLRSDFPDRPELTGELIGYFPPVAVDRCGHLVEQHPLRRELIATIVANDVVNAQGITFVNRLVTELGSTPAEVVRAYRTARTLTCAEERWRDVEDLVGRVPPGVQRALLGSVDDLVESTARWYLRHPSADTDEAVLKVARSDLERLTSRLAEIGPPGWSIDRRAEAAQLQAAGVPDELADRHTYLGELVHGPDIVEVAASTGRSVEEVARVFLRVGQAFHLDVLEDDLDDLGELAAESRWQRWALQTIAEDLLLLRRQLAEHVLDEAGEAPVDEAVDRYVLARSHAQGRLTRLMRAINREGSDQMAAIIVAIRQIRTLTI